MKIILKNWKSILLFIISWSIGFYTLRVTAIRIDLNKPDQIHYYLILLLFFSIAMILLPFLKSLKIGKILELEREITETKTELRDTKTELKQSINLALTSINTSINSMTNSINITVPGVEEMRKEFDKLKKGKESTNGNKIKNDLSNFIDTSDGDLNFALAKTRMEIERLIREILGKRTSVSNNSDINMKFLSPSKLFKLLKEQYPEFDNYYNSYRYVVSVCNAAIHGQRISHEQANEALQLGVIIINELKERNND